MRVGVGVGADVHVLVCVGHACMCAHTQVCENEKGGERKEKLKRKLVEKLREDGWSGSQRFCKPRHLSLVSLTVY